MVDKTWIVYFGNWYRVTILRSTPKRYFVSFTLKNGRTLERWVQCKRLISDAERRETARRFEEYRRAVGI
jgi:hypothetical protein